jgi:hypothetical protein
MAQSFHLREQAERCRRLARDSADPTLRDSLLKLADESTARASAPEDNDISDDAAIWQAVRTTRTLIDWLAAIGVRCRHQPLEITGHARPQSTN